MKDLVNLAGGWKNVLHGIAEGSVLTGALFALYAAAMLAPK